MESKKKILKRQVLQEELKKIEIESASRIKLSKILNLNRKNPEKINDNLIDIIAEPDMIWNSYQRIKKNKGLMTLGTNKESPDGFNQNIVEKISNNIKEGYVWKEIRRKNIPKPGKKNEKRPIGIPNLNNQIVQENIRLVLDTIYEPCFQKLNVNHGFRPNRSAETAVENVRLNSQGMTTAIEGDFKKDYDNVRKDILIEILKKKISDKKFLNLIKDSFSVKIIDKEKNLVIDSQGVGVPQGGLASPIIFNIVMHEFDKKVLSTTSEILEKKNKEEERMEKTKSKKYERIRIKINNTKRIMKNNMNAETKKYKNFEKQKETKKELRKLLTEKRNTEPMVKCRQILTFYYTRYADSWIILTNADKETCKKIVNEINVWVKDNIKLELNMEKTLVTDLTKENAKFLGFSIYKAEKKTITYTAQEQTRKRRLNIGMAIGYDANKILDRLRNDYIINEKNFPIHNAKYTILESWQIVELYTQKIRGIFNYYYHAITVKSSLNYLYYLIKFSCLKTLANKQKSSIRNILIKYGTKLEIEYKIYNWDIALNKEVEVKRKKEFPSYSELMNWASDLSKEKTKERIINKMLNKERKKEQEIIEKARNSDITSDNTLQDIERNIGTLYELKFNLRSGSQATKWCVICYEPNGIYNPIQSHDIRSLKGRVEGFDAIQKAINKKTIPCCRECYKKIHNKQYNGIALGKIMDRVLSTI